MISVNTVLRSSLKPTPNSHALACLMTEEANKERGIFQESERPKLCYLGRWRMGAKTFDPYGVLGRGCCRTSLCGEPHNECGEPHNEVRQHKRPTDR